MVKQLILTAMLAAPLSLQAQMRPGTVDVFMGVDFNYRDIYINKNRVFDVLVNLTPGAKWNLGKRWEVAAQALIPVVNQYGDHYKHVRLNNLSLSKQLAVGKHWKMKFSGGLFTQERYGIDWKNMFVFNRYLAFTAQVGLTGYCSMASGWEASKPAAVMALAGPVVYLPKWNTEVSIRGGRYLYGDYGCMGEVFRHFKHVSVGVFAAYSKNGGNETHYSHGGKDAGFKVVIMLPPYKRSNKRVNFRPASNFRLTYSMEVEETTNRTYFTDPEENERTQWFDRDLLPWGQETMAPDFTYKERKEAKQ